MYSVKILFTTQFGFFSHRERNTFHPHLMQYVSCWWSCWRWYLFIHSKCVGENGICHRFCPWAHILYHICRILEYLWVISLQFVQRLIKFEALTWNSYYELLFALILANIFRTKSNLCVQANTTASYLNMANYMQSFSYSFEWIWMRIQVFSQIKYK